MEQLTNAEFSAGVSAPPRRRFAELRSILDGRVVSLVIVFVVLIVLFDVLTGGVFFTPRNVSLLLRQASIVAIVSAGVSILMIMGEIDLSIGSAVYLCSVVASIVQVRLGCDTLVAVASSLACGMVLGAIMGGWVVLANVPSFVVTLAGLLAFRGLGYQASGAETIAPVQRSLSFLSEGFIPPAESEIAAVVLALAVLGYLLWSYLEEKRARVPTYLGALLLRVATVLVSAGFLVWAFAGFRGAPMALIWVFVLGFLLWVLMSGTKFGRNAYLIGSNREAARLSGISIRLQVFLGFALMGFLYGVGGTLITARLGGATPSSGTYLELDAIASAVIGGTSLRGGVGTVAGAMAGALLLTTIDNGMSILNVSAFLQLVVKGIVLLLAVALDSYMATSGKR
jgi:D-xylose transport system permease protein